MDAPPPGPTDEQQTSFRFGRFLVERVLGQGTFATVYLAVHLGEFGIRKPMALKVLRRRIAGFEDKATAGLINEARLGARMRHPNLVEFYECGQIGDRIYISMELIEGPNLAQVRTTAKELPYPVDQSLVVSIALQTARGLAALHRATLDGARMEAIHQDLKPGNVLLTSDGQAKITDFGISRFATDFYMTLGIEGPRGSPLYMSPEQSRGVELTQASDVFSWATTILELAVGKPVFAAPSLEEILRNVQGTNVGDAMVIARKRVPDLAVILERCLTADPAERIQDGDALVEELRQVSQPPFGDDAIARIAKDIYAILSDRMSMIAGQSVRHLLRSEDDDADGSPFDLAHTDTGERTPDGMVSMDDTQRWTRGEDSEDQVILFPGEASSEDDAVGEVLHRIEVQEEPAGGNRAVWIAAAVVGVIVVVGLGVVAALMPWGEILGTGGGTEEVTEGEVVEPATEAVEPTTEVVEPATEIVEPTTEAVEPTTEAVETPTEVVEPTTEVVEPATEVVESTTEAVVEPDTPVLRIQHDPVSRGILGQDVALSLQVSPPGSYRVVVHYRALPGGSWQVKTGYGGDDGAIRITIPGGDWQAEDSQSVEYWLELHGDDLAGTTGSAGAPHRYRLY